MPTEITTVSVHPQRAEKLREFRDSQDDVSTLDEALGQLLREKGE